LRLQADHVLTKTKKTPADSISPLDFAVIQVL
jgi:hypothetical protein